MFDVFTQHFALQTNVCSLRHVCQQVGSRKREKSNQAIRNEILVTSTYTFSRNTQKALIGLLCPMFGQPPNVLCDKQDVGQEC